MQPSLLVMAIAAAFSFALADSGASEILALIGASGLPGAQGADTSMINFIVLPRLRHGFISELRTPPPRPAALGSAGSITTKPFRNRAACITASTIRST